MQNKNTILWHFVGHFCGVLTRNFVAFWRTLLRCGACGDDGWGKFGQVRITVVKPKDLKSFWSWALPDFDALAIMWHFKASSTSTFCKSA